MVEAEVVEEADEDIAAVGKTTDVRNNRDLISRLLDIMIRGISINQQRRNTPANLLGPSVGRGINTNHQISTDRRRRRRRSTALRQQRSVIAGRFLATATAKAKASSRLLGKARADEIELG